MAWPYPYPRSDRLISSLKIGGKRGKRGVNWQGGDGLPFPIQQCYKEAIFLEVEVEF